MNQPDGMIVADSTRKVLFANPAAAGAITTTAWVSFALVEALAIFALVIALIILFG